MEEFTYEDYAKLEADSGCAYIAMKRMQDSMRLASLDEFLRKGARVIDVGCGSGFLLKELREKYPDIELFGADISLRSAEIAKRVAPSAEIICADMQKLPFRDSYFDAVVCSNIYDLGWGRYMQGFDALKQIYETHRVTKYGGIYYAFDSNLFGNVVEALKGPFNILETIFKRKSDYLFVKEKIANKKKN